MAQNDIYKLSTFNGVDWVKWSDVVPELRDTRLRDIADAWNDYKMTGSTAILHQRLDGLVNDE